MKYVSFSLDCELAWGFADLEPPIARVERMREDASNVRDSYRKILDAFDTYDVAATFAFVGHLFLDSCHEGSHPTNHLTTPRDPYSSLKEDPLYYGLDLVEMVIEAEVDHEIGGHSFSHPNFQNVDHGTARTEIEGLTDVAADIGIDIDSFVYPRNFVAYTDVLKEYDIGTYRGLTVGENYIFRHGLKSFLTRDETFWSIPPVRPSRTDDNLVTVGGSRLLHEVRWCYLHPIRLRRTLDRMDVGEVAHFCFHPHDMLGYFKLDWVLDRVLRVVEEYRDRGQIDVVTMNEMPSIVSENNQ